MKSMDDRTTDKEGFHLVTRKNKKYKTKKKCVVPRNIPDSTADSTNICDLEDKIASCRLEVRESPYYSSLLAHLQSLNKLLVTTPSLDMCQTQISELEECGKNLCESRNPKELSDGRDFWGTRNKESHGKDEGDSTNHVPRKVIGKDCCRNKQVEWIEAPQEAFGNKVKIFHKPVFKTVTAESESTVNHQGGIRELLCYGLGQFSHCLIARYQLALLLALQVDFQISTESVHIYDPVFNSQELQLLNDTYRLNVIAVNEEGRRPCESGCLVVMPHCAKQLYNNLLWANWGLQLSSLILYGNSFSSIIERIPERLLRPSGHYILSIQPFVKEIQIDNSFHHQDVFNDTSLHWFPRDGLLQADSAFWKRGSPPEYLDCDELEFIRTK